MRDAARRPVAGRRSGLSVRVPSGTSRSAHIMAHGTWVLLLGPWLGHGAHGVHILLGVSGGYQEQDLMTVDVVTQDKCVVVSAPRPRIVLPSGRAAPRAWTPGPGGSA